MRNATREELDSINNYIESISKSTGVNLFDELLKQNEQLAFTQKVADGSLNFVDELTKMQEYIDDHTQVLFCSPRTKKRILDLSIPLCEVIASPVIPDEEVYVLTDENLKKNFLKSIRGTDDSLWYNAEPIDWRK